MHATARAISGGPVYCSDRPGIHDFEVISRVVLPDGSVLRCRSHARPTHDCLLADILRDGHSVLKLWNLNSYSGVMGVFNIQGSSWSIAHRGFVMHDPHPPDLVAMVGPADVARLPPAEAYAVYRDSTQELWVMKREERMSVAVAGAGGCDLLTISPLAGSRRSAVRVAPIGLTGMLNCGGAVLSCRAVSGAEAKDGGASAERADIEKPDGGAAPGQTDPEVAFELEVKGSGAFLVYSSHRPSSVEVGGGEAPFQFDPHTSALTFELPAAGLVQKRVMLRFIA